MTRQEILHFAIDTYGENAQVDMCIEEASELTKALLKLRRYRGDASKCDTALYTSLCDNILEEIADVQIMLDQMRIIYGGTSANDTLKIARLAQRLGVSYDN